MSLSTAPASPVRDEDLGGDHDDDANEKPSTSVALAIDDDEIEFIDYVDESQLEHVMKLVIQDLSEPYSSTSLLLSCGDAPSLPVVHV
jgi:2-hydroxy-3-keto-5-methylthiopentenyl-1-phosphate phosphatase